jgi:hypothetical protein
MLCLSQQFALETIQTLIDDGGEGVILRKVKSLYVCGISAFLIKLKVRVFKKNNLCEYSKK